jgi:hypothetical protein
MRHQEPGNTQLADGGRTQAELNYLNAMAPSFVARWAMFLITNLVVAGILYGLLQLITWGDAHLVLTTPKHPYKLRVAMWAWLSVMVFFGTLIATFSHAALQENKYAMMWFGVLVSVAACAFITFGLDRSKAEIAALWIGLFFAYSGGRREAAKYF